MSSCVPLSELPLPLLRYWLCWLSWAAAGGLAAAAEAPSSLPAQSTQAPRARWTKHHAADVACEARAEPLPTRRSRGRVNAQRTPPRQVALRHSPS